ncbi:MAG: succinate dehydrogenase assembly factor 2 [Pseudomonadota bacterium]
MSDGGESDGALRLKKLQWLARRGMRELEILIERFLLREREALNAGEWADLESLLACEDDRLWDWFQGRLDDEAEPYQHLINAIRR